MDISPYSRYARCHTDKLFSINLDDSSIRALQISNRAANITRKHSYYLRTLSHAQAFLLRSNNHQRSSLCITAQGLLFFLRIALKLRILYSRRSLLFIIYQRCPLSCQHILRCTINQAWFLCIITIYSAQISGHQIFGNNTIGRLMYSDNLIEPAVHSLISIKQLIRPVRRT